jgi:DNA (cytosine-5)-methyltransferase 1
MSFTITDKADSFKEACKNMKRVVDLFAGCGGLTQGFQDAGYNMVGAFEIWEVAATCYAENFKGHPIFRDDLSRVQDAVNKIRALNPEIIIGGPPCQAFSHAGKRVEDERAELTEAYANIVTAIHPRWFVMENVDRILKSKAYASARATLSSAGYGLTEVVLNAALCGAPQRRKRFFCIGSLNQQDGFLLDFIKQSQSKKEMSMRDYFGDTLGFEHYYRHPRNYCRRAIYSIDEPSPTIRGVNRPVPQGYPGHIGDSCAVTSSLRPMTTQERALVQTFPIGFKWIGSKTDAEQMIGNAVPVKLAEFVGKALAYHIQTVEDGAAHE